LGKDEVQGASFKGQEKIPGQARDDAERHIRIPVRIRDIKHLPVIPVVAERRTGISELGALLRLGGY